MPEDELTERVYCALNERALSDEDLSARRLAKFLGKTTGAVYHRFGSLDGFLYAVSQRGFGDLRLRLMEVYAGSGDVQDLAQAFVEFGLDRPELYALMFERRYDWTALCLAEETKPESQVLLDVLLGLLAEAGSPDAMADARLLMAGLHGLVSLASSGRVNVRTPTTSDREVAVLAARDLAHRLLPKGPAR